MTCRRCSECPNSEHHWLDNPDFGLTDFDSTHVCKHCEATGEQCVSCDGTGICDDGQDSLCKVCDGEGVCLIDIGVCEAVDTILIGWNEWDAQAAQVAQQEQCDDVWEYEMRRHLHEVLCKLRSKECKA